MWRGHSCLPRRDSDLLTRRSRNQKVYERRWRWGVGLAGSTAVGIPKGDETYGFFLFGNPFFPVPRS
jgi:hypothetical protein